MNKTVLITGASRGIGKEIAITFAKNGFNIVATCHNNIDSLISLKKEILKYNVNIFLFQGDLSKQSTLSDLIKFLNNNNISVDVLINNAGISVVGLIQDLSIDDWNYIWNTNVTAPIFLSKELVPHFLHNHSGKIINISSVWGNVGASCEVAYSATKGAINSFTKALAKELAPSNIQVNAISCGIIDTDMNSHLSSDDINEIVTDIPAGRIGTPKDIALTALSLVNGSDYLTGQIITVDGGWI